MDMSPPRGARSHANSCMMGAVGESEVLPAAPHVALNGGPVLTATESASPLPFSGKDKPEGPRAGLKIEAFSSPHLQAR